MALSPPPEIIETYVNVTCMKYIFNFIVIYLSTTNII